MRVSHPQTPGKVGIHPRSNERGLLPVLDKIVVFGSHFKGNAGKDSDIDLIIVSENFRRKDLFKRAGMASKAYGDTVRKFTVAMDIIMETPEEFNPDFGMVVYAA